MQLAIDAAMVWDGHLTAVSTLDDRTSRPYRGAGREDSDRLFRRARRHSRLVRFLQRAIPVGIGLGLAVIVGIAYFNPFRALAKLPVDPGRLVISGTKITMEAPRLAGYTRDSRPYELTAATAAQDVANPGVLELKVIRAKVQMRDAATLRLEAATGVYDTKADLLQLREKIVLSSSGGYTGRLEEANVDIREGRITSDRPVKVEMLNGTLDAANMVVTNSGDVVTFGGGVVMNMMPGSLGIGSGGARTDASADGKSAE
jgi:lipopolysaccharide export system protein LptC